MNVWVKVIPILSMLCEICDIIINIWVFDISYNVSSKSTIVIHLHIFQWHRTIFQRWRSISENSYAFSIMCRWEEFESHCLSILKNLPFLHDTRYQGRWWRQTFITFKNKGKGSNWSLVSPWHSLSSVWIN